MRLFFFPLNRLWNYTSKISNRLLFSVHFHREGFIYVLLVGGQEHIVMSYILYILYTDTCSAEFHQNKL